MRGGGSKPTQGLASACSAAVTVWYCARCAILLSSSLFGSLLVFNTTFHFLVTFWSSDICSWTYLESLGALSSWQLHNVCSAGDELGTVAS